MNDHTPSLTDLIAQAADDSYRGRRTSRKPRKVRKGRRCIYCNRVSPDSEVVTHRRAYIDAANVAHENWGRTTSYRPACHERQQLADKVSNACHDVLRLHRDLGLSLEDRAFVRRWLRKCETLEEVAVVRKTVEDAGSL